MNGIPICIIWHLLNHYRTTVSKVFFCIIIVTVVMINDHIDLSTFILSVELEMRRREDEYRFTSK